MKIEIDNVVEVRVVKITDDGRIYGLKKFSKKTAKVAILKD